MSAGDYLQSAFDVHPPVMNCWPLACTTFFAPALLGVTARAVIAKARVARIEMRTIVTDKSEIDAERLKMNIVITK